MIRSVSAGYVQCAHHNHFSWSLREPAVEGAIPGWYVLSLYYMLMHDSSPNLYLKFTGLLYYLYFLGTSSQSNAGAYVILLHP